MEIRVSIDDEFAKQLQQKLGVKKATEIVKSAMTLLDWVTDEVSKGRVILSSDRDGDNVHRLVMPGLGTAKTAGSKTSRGEDTRHLAADITSVDVALYGSSTSADQSEVPSKMKP